MKSTIKKPLFILAALVALGAGVGVSAVVSAQTAKRTAPAGQHMMDKRGPGVMGTVSSVNGTTILVAGKDGTAYTVNAATAKFMKMVEGTKPAVATIADVKVGETVGVQGTVTGTSVVATNIMTGTFVGGPGKGMGMRGGMGMHGLEGTVSSVIGNSVTLTTASSTPNIKVGDSIVVIPKK